MNDIRYILFTGSMQPKNPMVATEDKIKEIVTAGFRQGKDFDIVSEKVLKDKLGRRGGGMMNINDMIRPIGMAAGGPIPPEPEKTGMIKKIKDLFKYENESGTGSLLMDFLSNKGMFAPSGKKFDTSDSPMFEDAKPIGLLDDAGDLRILSMKLVLKEAADSLKEMDRIDRLSPDEIIIEFENLMGKKGA
jgi:hypothetical protein|tara:strand:+ start:514 stop:1083 length:570 start_codon:yes stop_codon:yes gene_type:complete